MGSICKRFKFCIKILQYNVIAHTFFWVETCWFLLLLHGTKYTKLRNCGFLRTKGFLLSNYAQIAHSINCKGLYLYIYLLLSSMSDIGKWGSQYITTTLIYFRYVSDTILKIRFSILKEFYRMMRLFPQKVNNLATNRDD